MGSNPTRPAYFINRILYKEADLTMSWCLDQI
jgi:hypothetical protein